jgi:hypothetical protein
MEKLTKQVLAAFDGNDVLELFIPTNQKQLSEYAAQVININGMMAPSPGRPAFPAPVLPTEDQPTRIKADMDWLHACSTMGVPVDPMAMQRVQQDVAQRMEILKQQNPDAHKQIGQMIQQAEQSAMQPQPQNGQQMQIPERNGNIQSV